MAVMKAEMLDLLDNWKVDKKVGKWVDKTAWKKVVKTESQKVALRAA